MPKDDASSLTLRELLKLTGNCVPYPTETFGSANLFRNHRKRELQAEDMTGPAVFFASDDAAMVSGQLLCVDGGMTMPA